MAAPAGMSFVLDREAQHKLLTVTSNQELQRDLNASYATHNDDVDRLEGEVRDLAFDLDNEQYHVGELEESIDNLVAEKVAADLVASGWEARAESMERHIARLEDEMKRAHEQIKTLQDEKKADVKFWQDQADSWRGHCLEAWKAPLSK